jgi:hypothetical protein
LGFLYLYFGIFVPVFSVFLFFNNGSAVALAFYKENKHFTSRTKVYLQDTCQIFFISQSLNIFQPLWYPKSLNNLTFITKLCYIFKSLRHSHPLKKSILRSSF